MIIAQLDDAGMKCDSQHDVSALLDAHLGLRTADWLDVAYLSSISSIAELRTGICNRHKSPRRATLVIEFHGSLLKSLSLLRYLGDWQ